MWKDDCIKPCHQHTTEQECILGHNCEYFGAVYDIKNDAKGDDVDNESNEFHSYGCRSKCESFSKESCPDDCEIDGDEICRPKCSTRFQAKFEWKVEEKTSDCLDGKTVQWHRDSLTSGDPTTFSSIGESRKTACFGKCQWFV